jgi:lysine-N-methylase
MMFVYLDILPDFVCAQCGTCCSNDWLVTVDEAGYRRNREIFRVAGWAEEFEQAFIPLEGAAEPGEYARIAKNGQGGCCFLNTKKLCRLQQLAGHQHLDPVCQWFPRYPMDTERGIEISLSFSCPAAVKLALREKPLRLVRSEQSPVLTVPVDFVRNVYPGQQSERSVMRYYFELEQHLIGLIQARIFSLSERLELICETLARLDSLGRRDEPGRELNRLIQENYDHMDAAEAERALLQRTPAEWLGENFFLNFLFRKNLYLRGFQWTGQQLRLLEAQLQPALAAAIRSGDTTGLEQRIIALELEWNHNCRTRPGK